MDVAPLPELKQALFENQMHFKYIVYVSDLYFESFTKKSGMISMQRNAKKCVKIYLLLDDHMSGNNASGRSLIAQF
jgi:hypothetical protein